MDGKFVCFGLEDEYREDKVLGETRIPNGQYTVGVRTEGGFHTRYSKDRRFKDIHKGMLQVMNVPGFEYILIHVGNTDKDTAGCLLVGTGAIATPGDMSIQSSSVGYRVFYSKVIDEALQGNLYIRYVDSDR